MEQLELEGQVQTASEENAILKQVHATHTPLGCQVNVDLIINITEQILIQAITRGNVNGGVDHEKSERLDTSMKAAGFAELDAQDTFMIHKLSRELSCSKVSGVAQAHAKTMQLLNTLSSYTWLAKLVLVLSGFAVNFGEFWLAVEPHPIDILSQSLALLRKLPNIGHKSFTWKHQFDILNKLVKTALDVTKCIFEVKNLPSDYISEDAPLEEVNAHIPQNVYCAILSIVTCSSEIASALRWRNEYISSNKKIWELSNLLSNLTIIHEELKNYMDMCYKYIVRKILHQSWTYSNENLQTNIAASNKTKVSTRVNIQRRKHMLLLISDLDISEEEIEVLDNLYKDQKMRSETLYEMIWVPILDRSIGNDLNQDKFDELKSKTSWYNFHNPVIDPAIIKQIKEQWKFRKQPIVVVLNQQDEVSSTNAIHIMRIWGNSAFSFTPQIEKDLWSSWNRSLEMIIDRVDAVILEWMKQKEDICLYGGVDLEWIRTFTKTATSSTRVANIDLKMAYVGKSNAKKEMQKMITIFDKEQLSYFLPNATSIWFFWALLQSIVYLRSQHGTTVEDNDFMSQVNTLLTYDGREKGWAIFFEGSYEYPHKLGIWHFENETPLQNFATAQNFVPKFSYFYYGLRRRRRRGRRRSWDYDELYN